MSHIIRTEPEHDMDNRNATHRASPTLYQHVRAKFVLRGSTLNAWSRDNSVAQPNARKALMGEWTGPKASEPVSRIVAANEGRG